MDVDVVDVGFIDVGELNDWVYRDRNRVVDVTGGAGPVGRVGTAPRVLGLTVTFCSAVDVWLALPVVVAILRSRRVVAFVVERFRRRALESWLMESRRRMDRMIGMGLGLVLPDGVDDDGECVGWHADVIVVLRLLLSLVAFGDQRSFVDKVFSVAFGWRSERRSAVPFGIAVSFVVLGAIPV